MVGAAGVYSIGNKTLILVSEVGVNVGLLRSKERMDCRQAGRMK